LRDFPIAQSGEFLLQPDRLKQIPHVQRAFAQGQRIRHRLADAQAATAVPLSITGDLAQAIERLMIRCGDQRRPIDRQPLDGIRDAQGAQMLFFAQQVQRINQHEARQVSAHARHQRAAAKLPKGVMSAARIDDVMRGLRAAVVADNRPRGHLPRQAIHDRAFTRIAITQIGYQYHWSLRHRLLLR